MRRVVAVVVIAACHGPSGTDTAGGVQDTGEDTIEDTADTGAVRTGFPEDDPLWWTLENNPLHGLVEADPDPTSGWEVLLCTSPDGETWDLESCQVVAHNFSSLGLVTVSGYLVVTGVVDPDDLGIVVNHRALYALVTPDLATWTVRAWYFSDDPNESVNAEAGHDSLVDPQFELGDEAEDHPWFYAFPDGWSDPAIIPGDHDLCEGVLEGEDRVRETGCPLSVARGADPSPLRHGGRFLVAATETEPFQAVIWDLTSGEAVRGAAFAGSVPFLTPWGDGLRLWYQSNDDGLHARVVDSFDGGVSWSEPAAPFGDEMECTSHVAAPFGDTWVLLCARRQERVDSE